MRFAALIGLITIPLLANAANAGPVWMEGNTTANTRLSEEVMKAVMLYADALWSCSSAELIQPEFLQSYKPYRVGPEGSAKTIYERWTVTLCGKKRRFLVAFWPSSVGGTMFRVQYPFR